MNFLMSENGQIVPIINPLTVLGKFSSSTADRARNILDECYSPNDCLRIHWNGLDDIGSSSNWFPIFSAGGASRLPNIAMDETRLGSKSLN